MPMSSSRPNPRLQHSPSLPNIWFPPHSSPHMASRPEEIASALENLSLNLTDSRPTTNNITTPSYPRKRQRKDRDVSQHLLTPPLTPSSSIRTTASAESAEGKQDDRVQTLSQIQEPEATRFLYLENVSRTVATSTIQSAISDALSHLSHRRDLPRDAKVIPAHDSDPSCIKGFFLTHTKTTGTLFLAFHDVRDAIAAKLVLSQRSDGVLAECLGEEKLIDGAQAWFRCRFITADELVKTIGNSNFLATTDGGFLLSVAFVDYNNDSQTRDPGATKREVDLQLLAKLLEAYGKLRLLKPADDSQSFLVEFFDAREASEAYASLNEQTMFGMKLRTSGRVPPDQEENYGALEIPLTYNKPGQDRSDTPLSIHHPSASESHIPKLRPSLGPAGEASQMRNRFTTESTRSRPRAASVGDETTSSTSPPRPSDRQPKAPSPPIFYTTFDFADPYPTSSRISDEKLSNVRTAEQNTHSSEDTTSPPFKKWEPQQACSILECRYCPSRGHDSTTTILQQQPFSNHINPPPFVNTGSFPAQTPPPHVFSAPPEFEIQGIYPSSGWPFDPNMMMQPLPPPGGNIDMFTPAFIPAIPVVPVEHRFPADQCPPNPNFVPNGLVFPSISPALHVPPPTFITEPQPHPPPSMLTDHHNIFISNSVEPTVLPPIDIDATIKLHGTPSPGVSDRNFLNISRIEEGLDTRTTVMIKNIPNKMTAKDLIQYISEVCPRKIDFLYLRMDFKNGCNVGYAFVNFIRVEEMLKFAKNRLGVKWNLFSSEKVLQMSYANYQGKEALVEKFKNSCIMDEREEWRPKIFYSSGPEQGLPEPFPAPTHLRRKERSSHNRGALYVPGVSAGVSGSSGNSGSGGNGGYLNNGSSSSMRRHQEFYSGSSGSSTKYLEHRNRNGDRCTTVGDFHPGGSGGSSSGRRSKVHFERSR